MHKIPELQVPTNYVALIDEPYRIKTLMACLQRLGVKLEATFPLEVRKKIFLSCIDVVHLQDILTRKYDYFTHTMVANSTVKISVLTAIGPCTYTIDIQDIQLTFRFSKPPRTSLQLVYDKRRNGTCRAYWPGYEGPVNLCKVIFKARDDKIRGVNFGYKSNPKTLHQLIKFVD